MSYKIITFGKFNRVPNTEIDENMYISGCYFDWFKIEHVNEEIKELKDIYSKMHIDIENEILHTQETMILMSDEDKENVKFPGIAYISMINLPMLNESKITSDQYCEFHEKAKSIICDKVKNELSISVYNTFDHCDLVLFCDGEKTTLDQYMKIIKNIRNETLILGEEKVSLVHDITTIYGFNEKNSMYLPTHYKYNIVLSLSFKSPNYAKKFAELLKNENLNIDFQSEIIGRYDTILFIKNINSTQIYKVLKRINENSNLFFAKKIHLGLDDTSVFKEDVKENNLSNLLCFAEKKFFDAAEKLQTRLEIQLFSALREIHLSICSMLRRGFAQYYILCFYESFYSFVDFLVFELDKKSKNEKDLINRKISEQIYDMYKTYFSFLNALNAGTLHSDRQFLQIDSYHAMYFDAPPKLIAFYTAMANKMAIELNKNSQNKYTFLITPDFKEDIFVESLTRDKTLGGERNVLIIHINESSMYDVANTLRIIAHEIAHHIGQDESIRKQRSELYLKAFLANTVWLALDDEYLYGENDDQKTSFLNNLVEKLYFKLFHSGWQNEFLNKEEVNEERTKRIFYYADDLLEAYERYIRSKFISDDIEQLIYDILNEIVDKPSWYSKEFTNEFWNNLEDKISEETDKKLLDQFVLRKVSENFARAMARISYNEKFHPTLCDVKYLFRESYADMQMFMLTSDISQDNSFQIFKQMLKEKEFSEMNFIDKERLAVLLSFFESKKTESEEFINDFLKFEGTMEFGEGTQIIKNQKFTKKYYLYLFDITKKYLTLVKKSLTLDSDSVENNIRIIESFQNINNSSFIKLVDKEIFNYRRRLTREYNDTKMA